MITIHSFVKSTHPIGSIPKGTNGVVVFEYGTSRQGDKGFEVEFFDDKGITIAVSTVYTNDIN